MNGLVVAVVGLLLCFYGIRSVHLGILAIGFGLGWMIADLFNATFWWLLLVALIGAVSSWVVTSLIFRFASYFIGGLTGAMIGTKLATVLQPGDKNWALSMIVALAVCVAGAFLAEKFRARALLWLTSIGGASMILSGVARMDDSLEFLRSPEAGWQQITSTLAWVGLSVLGWIVQRHLFAERLGIEHLAGDGEGDSPDMRQRNGGWPAG
ncbi:TMEM198/TM7SF3 family protein [Nocardia cyriacigeorgica]|uniref:TMEM198/TM7SF3 family protein n=1 Tax=Nocardia cyriacigeorgica TaxID=135487 RepID=A0A6P1DCE4_9NOCA|nr:TMEM198/TM7SF3 family protein [Nocardia cyriacigeorgica]NEW40011.1 TMEM198/TM7SF3 family protein [Nocardia cyriacigeorgica]NEW46834.1 TMEM198/TM7SF3 family protein [Nocardia cyriacigeorgica]NEW53625.1 TMEM198/TM7SF3 family protein [Nocardia cyriacigeorgica]NEW58333.1 TMEM198/TM7SF3 family protein [Nocardia cyriacigeorgica]